MGLPDVEDDPVECEDGALLLGPLATPSLAAASIRARLAAAATAKHLGSVIFTIPHKERPATASIIFFGSARVGHEPFIESGIVILQSAMRDFTSASAGNSP